MVALSDRKIAIVRTLVESAPDKIVGAKEVATWGGQVHTIPFRHDRSTTQLLSRIRT